MGNYVILDLCPKLFYRIVLFFIHNILWLMAKSVSLWSSMKRWYVAATELGPLANRYNNCWREVKTLRHAAKILTKMPKHTVIVLTDENDISTESLANLVTWSVCCGTLYVTLYDKKGNLLTCQDEIKSQVLKKLKALLGDDFVKYSLIFKDSSSSYGNGYVYTTGVCVQVISEDDCRKDIVDVSKQILEQIDSQLIDDSDIDSSLINSKLNAIKGLPDPDLAIQFGSIQFLDGCLPWQMRLTEIISLESCRNIHVDDFVTCLRRFSKCEQRFGK